LSAKAMRVNDTRMGVNYGLNRVRFPSPVPVNSRVRAVIKLVSYEPIEGGAQITTEVTIEREGSPKPVCVAETVARRYTGLGEPSRSIVTSVVICAPRSEE